MVIGINRDETRSEKMVPAREKSFRSVNLATHAKQMNRKGCMRSRFLRKLRTQDLNYIENYNEKCTRFFSSSSCTEPKRSILYSS